jgi:hypothetical protein
VIALVGIALRCRVGAIAIAFAPRRARLLDTQVPERAVAAIQAVDADLRIDIALLIAAIGVALARLAALSGKACLAVAAVGLVETLDARATRARAEITLRAFGRAIASAATSARAELVAADLAEVAIAVLRARTTRIGRATARFDHEQENEINTLHQGHLRGDSKG